MAVCPHCNERLARVQRPQGFVFQCPSCQGFAVAVPVLRKVVSHDVIREMWLRAREEGNAEGVECPVCRQPTVEVTVDTEEDQGKVTIDVCARCQFVWFDREELEQLPQAEYEPSLRDRLPMEAREKLALTEIKRLERMDRLRDTDQGPPEHIWQWIPGLLGLPVEIDAPAIASWPWLTWALLAVMAITFGVTVNNLEAAVETLGLIPADFTRLGGLTFITSFFLHASFWHVLTNGYFLLVFGDQVEDELGRWRYAGLVALAALVGDIFHILADLGSTIPCVGASGGISGIITFYALRFPNARLGVAFRYFLYIRWFQFPAWAGFGVWLFLQLILMTLQLQGATSVSAAAHLGGCLVGLGAWILWQLGQLKAA